MKKTVKMNPNHIILTVGIILAFVLRFWCRAYESADFNGFLKRWVETFANNGRWYALKDDIGDYNVVYQYILILLSYIPVNCLYSIKAVSVIFDVLMAYGCSQCLAVLGVRERNRTLCFVFVLLLPTVWLNSALWAQCDSIYVCFIIWSLYCLLREKMRHSLVLLALAFAFKLQTVFVMPVYFILFLKKKIRFRELFLFPVTFFATCIPALLFGKPLWDILSIYFRQTRQYPLMVMNAPSALGLFEIIHYNSLLEKLCILAAVVFVSAVCAACLRRKEELLPEQIVSLFAIFSLAVPFLLPHMHDRYFYIADIITVLFAFSFGKKYFAVPVMCQMASLICYLQYLGWINLYGGTLSAYIFNGITAAALILLCTIFLCLLHCRNFFKLLKRLRIRQLAAAAIIPVVLVTGVSQMCFNKDKVHIKVDGKLVNYFGIYAHETDNMVMMPLRGIFNACGYDVQYDYDQNCIRVSGDSMQIVFETGSDLAQTDSGTIKLICPITSITDTNHISAYDFCSLTGLQAERQGPVLHFHSVQ